MSTAKKRTPPPRPPKPKPKAKPVERQAAAAAEPPQPPEPPRFRPAAEIKHAKKRAMLTALGRLGIITHAVAAAGITRQTHYSWVESDPAYAAEAERAQEWHVEQLEAEADRRALEGVLEPVTSGGKVVAWRRRYSDTLLIFRLKALRPEVYRERQEVKLAGKVETDPPRAITIEQRRAFLQEIIREIQERQLAEGLEEKLAEGASNGEAGQADPAHQNGRAH